MVSAGNRAKNAVERLIAADPDDEPSAGDVRDAIRKLSKRRNKIAWAHSRKSRRAWAEAQDAVEET